MVPGVETLRHLSLVRLRSFFEPVPKQNCVPNWNAIRFLNSIYRLSLLPRL